MATPTQAGAFALQAGERPISIRKFSGFVVLAGLLNATIAAFFICHLPAAHAPSLHSLIVRAFLYVAFAVVAGTAGARFYWNQFFIPFNTDPPLSFSLYALVNAEAWVWVPAIVLLSRQDSPASAVFSAVGAALLANGLRRVIPNAAGPYSCTADSTFERREMFVATLHTAPREAHAYFIALCLYATGYFLFNHFYLNAGAPLAVGAFLFSWNRTLEPATALDFSGTRTRASHRLAAVATIAVLVTLLILLTGIGHRNRVDAANLALAQGNGQGADASQNQRHPAGPYVAGISGYESIILWPVPEKKQIVAPIEPSLSPSAERIAKPLIIRFDGPYWYFQPPSTHPGPRPHEAQGDPLAVNIAANNFIPLNTEAVQTLGAPIRIARCRVLQITIENRDNLRGPIALGVVLTDSLAAGKPSISLGEQTVVSSEANQFLVKLSPVEEVLRYAIPSRAAIRKFDRITVLYLPGAEHWQTGAKIAIKQFELIPR